MTITLNAPRLKTSATTEEALRPGGQNTPELDDPGVEP